MFYGKNQEHAFGSLRNNLKLKQLLPLILGNWTLNWGAWDKDSFCPQTFYNLLFVVKTFWPVGGNHVSYAKGHTSFRKFRPWAEVEEQQTRE